MLQMELGTVFYEPEVSVAKPGSLELRKAFMKMWEEKARRETKTEKGPKKIQT